LYLSLLLLGLAGCAGISRQVVFSVSAPGKVALPPASRVAVFDFSSASGDLTRGRDYASQLAGLLQAQAGFTVLSPEQTRTYLAGMFASRLQDPAVVIGLGRTMKADYLLFGDLAALDLDRSVQEEKVQRLVGQREELVVVVQPDGNTQTVIRCFPVYAERIHRTIWRTVRITAQTRLVRTRDAFVVWEGSLPSDDQVKTEEENNVFTGDTTPDDMLLSQKISLHIAHLIDDLLPKIISRCRVLADAEGKDRYCQLINQGVMAALADDWARAGSLWLLAAGENPQGSEARGNLGILRERASELRDACQDYKFAAEISGQPWIDYAQEVLEIINKK
jgi:hypothetical protein